MQVARDTLGRKATSRCGLQLFFSQRLCHLLLGLKQDYPFYSPYGCRLGYQNIANTLGLLGRGESLSTLDLDILSAQIASDVAVADMQSLFHPQD